METLYERLLRGVAKALNSSSQASEREFVIALEKIDPEMAEEVKRRMFVFDDIVLLDDRSTQMMLREVEMDELATALKSTGPDAYEKITKNMSPDAVVELKTTMGELGSVRLTEVEIMQLHIIGIIRKLEDKGDITVPRMVTG